jgi:hypothetical protein
MAGSVKDAAFFLSSFEYRRHESREESTHRNLSSSIFSQYQKTSPIREREVQEAQPPAGGAGVSPKFPLFIH